MQEERKSKVKLQYVSNAGIIFEIKGKQIGIDCLCKDSTKLYQDTPLAIREELKLDILIFTHEHEDHFCPQYVKEAWIKNPAVHIYSTKNTIDALRANGISSENLHCVDDEQVLDVDAVKIGFMYSKHEGEQYREIQNLILFLKVEDKHLVITGDAMPCKQLFEKIGACSPNIDWFFAPFPYVGLRSTRKLMKEYLHIGSIFVLHLPREEADVQQWIANTKRVCEEAKDGLPQPIFPEKLGEWYCL